MSLWVSGAVTWKRGREVDCADKQRVGGFENAALQIPVWQPQARDMLANTRSCKRQALGVILCSFPGVLLEKSIMKASQPPRGLLAAPFFLLEAAEGEAAE